MSRWLDKRKVIFKQLCGIYCTFISFALIARDGSLQQATLLLVSFILLSVSVEQGVACWKMCGRCFGKYAVFVLEYKVLFINLDTTKIAMLDSYISWKVKFWNCQIYATFFSHLKINSAMIVKGCLAWLENWLLLIAFFYIVSEEAV